MVSQKPCLFALLLDFIVNLMLEPGLILRLDYMLNKVGEGFHAVLHKEKNVVESNQGNFFPFCFSYRIFLLSEGFWDSRLNKAIAPVLNVNVQVQAWNVEAKKLEPGPGS